MKVGGCTWCAQLCRHSVTFEVLKSELARILIIQFVLQIAVQNCVFGLLISNKLVLFIWHLLELERMSQILSSLSLWHSGTLNGSCCFESWVHFSFFHDFWLVRFLAFWTNVLFKLQYVSIMRLVFSVVHCALQFTSIFMFNNGLSVVEFICPPCLPVHRGAFCQFPFRK